MDWIIKFVNLKFDGYIIKHDRFILNITEETQCQNS